jgi:asparagine synthase (glutamine-hydrolysing)
LRLDNALATPHDVSMSTLAPLTHSHVITCGPFVAAADVGADLSTVTRSDGTQLVGCGAVRLDNRRELLASIATELRAPHLPTDLELVLRAYGLHGERVIEDLLGDYAYVCWDSRSHTLTAVRDAIGVRTLYVRRQRDMVALASRGDLLATEEAYNLPLLADVMLGWTPNVADSVFRQVASVPPASTLTITDRQVSQRRYWTPARTTSLELGDSSQVLIERWRDLFWEALQSHLSSPAATWSTLSGGLDSSGLVTGAHSLWKRGIVSEPLGGTISILEPRGGFDDSIFVSDVVAQVQSRHESVVSQGLWQRDGLPLQKTERPDAWYAAACTHRQVASQVVARGGRILWYGHGPDFMLSVHRSVLADLVSHGRIIQAVHHAHMRAVNSEQSIWHLLYRAALMPNLPRTLRRRSAIQRARIPRWVRRDFADAYALIERSPQWRRAGWRPGDHEQLDTEESLATMAWAVSRQSPLPGTLELRFPYLYRPLYEMSVGLPTGLRRSNGRKKVILREALDGTLPNSVCQRPAKSTLGSAIVWSLANERSVVDYLLRDSLLADLGIIEPRTLSRFIARCLRVGGSKYLEVMSVLSIETWLRVRAGLWRDPREPTSDVSRTYRDRECTTDRLSAHS